MSGVWAGPAGCSLKPWDPSRAETSRPQTAGVNVALYLPVSQESTVPGTVLNSGSAAGLAGRQLCTVNYGSLSVM